MRGLAAVLVALGVGAGLAGVPVAVALGVGAGLAGVPVAVALGVGAGLAGVPVAVALGVGAGLAGVPVAVALGVGAGLAGVPVAVALGVGAGLAGVPVAVALGVGAGLAGVPVAVALGVGAGLAERAAGVTTFASAESCMLADSPEPRKPPVTRTATTTRTRAEHMSAPLSPPLVRVGRSGGGQRRWFRYRCPDMAGAWLWVTNALNRCRSPRRVWRPATWDVTVSGPDRFRLRPVQPE